MFDIGFWELALIGVVALLVVGPDRLPGLARTVGLWVGRIRRYVATVRDDIEREIAADELKKMLDKPDDLNPLKDVIDETTGSISDMKNQIAGVEKEAEDMMSEDVTPAAAEDETGADAITPDSAATAIGEAVTAGGESAAPVEAVEEIEDLEDLENRDGDERRSG